jgi:hypothetical protein
MKTFSIPEGAMVFLGAPAKPMPEHRSAAIRVLVESVSGVTEAHLPQCFVLGVMPAPVQMLVLVLALTRDTENVIREISDGLDAIIPHESSLDIWPMMPNSDFLQDVRSANCRLTGPSSAGAPVKPWWRFWT